MRKYLIAAALLTALSVASPAVCRAGGSNRIIAVHPANTTGGTLTMEQAITSRDVYPTPSRAGWVAADELVYMQDGKYVRYNVTTGEEKEYNVERHDRRPRQAAEPLANMTPGQNGNVAYTRANGLYYTDAAGHEYCIASDDNPGIVYGQSVSRNEFGINEGIYWSPDGKKLAFYRKDESGVTDFPLLDINTRTGSLVTTKYPMNGMLSENVRVGIYDLASANTVYVAADDFGYDQYLTNVSWSPDAEKLFIQVLDRSQKHVRLNMYDSRTGAFDKTILTEEDDRYVEPLDHLHFIDGNYHFIYRTNVRDGYFNLYLCDTLGNVSRITTVDADVEYVGNDGKNVYYLSSEVSPVEHHLFKVAVSVSRKGKVTVGAKVRLTKDEGWHSVSASADCKYFLDSYSSFNNPGTTTLISSADGKVLKTLRQAADPFASYKTGEVILGSVKSADGKYDNCYRLYKPADFDSTRKYPVVVYVYGGPHSQLVTNSWLGQIRVWELLMAQRGYVVYVQDNRGTDNQGAEYEKCTHGHLGQFEMEDQMEGVKMLQSLPYVDKDRIGVHGWSYGGFMTISLMTHYPDVFKVGVAGGPVIDWKWYEVMYGERYMETAATNPEGFEATSLIPMAKSLKGKLLICQGAIDKTVVWEHSLSFIRECIKNQVPVDYFPYPCAEHNVFGRDRIHLMDKVSQYFEDYL